MPGTKSSRCASTWLSHSVDALAFASLQLCLASATGSAPVASLSMDECRADTHETELRPDGGTVKARPSQAV